MAVRPRPYEAGSIVRIRPVSGRGAHVTVKAPSGNVFILLTPRSFYDLWVPEVGDWALEWDDGTRSTLEVVTAMPVDDVELEQLAPDLVGQAPPMTIATRPRI